MEKKQENSPFYKSRDIFICNQAEIISIKSMSLKENQRRYK